jgi:hypothetical protein
MKQVFQEFASKESYVFKVKRFIELIFKQLESYVFKVKRFIK